MPLPAITIDQALNLAHAYHCVGQFDSAEKIYRNILEVNPDRVEACSNLGLIYRHRGDFPQAERYFRRAIRARPDLAEPHWNLGNVLLLQGNYEEGWKEFESRLSAPQSRTPMRNFSAPRWDGRPIPGSTLLVHAEEGSGDFIHFMRFIPQVIARSGGARVLLETPGNLLRLVKANTLDVEIIPLASWSGKHLPHFDLFVPLMSLPLALREFAPTGISGPYLRAESTGLIVPENTINGPKIGVVWAGDPRHPDDQSRSISPELLAQWRSIPSVVFYSLQIGQPVANWMIDLSPKIRDFADTAAVISKLDLIITVDTAVAHLAGAFGRPVWTLLPFVPDWRWGLGLETTPWYPTMRLFRQPRLGDWNLVIQRVATELRNLMENPMSAAEEGTPATAARAAR